MSKSVYKKQLGSDWYRKFGQRREKTNTHKLKQSEKKYAKAYELIESIQDASKKFTIDDKLFRRSIREAIDLWKLDNYPPKEICNDSTDEYANI